jgi:hypothetical protein
LPHGRDGRDVIQLIASSLQVSTVAVDIHATVHIEEVEGAIVVLVYKPTNNTGVGITLKNIEK